MTGRRVDADTEQKLRTAFGATVHQHGSAVRDESLPEAAERVLRDNRFEMTDEYNPIIEYIAAAAVAAGMVPLAACLLGIPDAEIKGHDMTEPKLTAAELAAGLQFFSGSESFYVHALNRAYRYTDGVHFLAENAGAYWLIDAVVAWQHDPAVRREGFQVWKLRRAGGASNAAPAPDGSWLLYCEDGNEARVAEQRLSWTSFPLDAIDLYCVDKCILLPGEY